MSYSITLTFEAPDLAIFENQSVCRVQCTASAAVNLDNEIFLFKKTMYSTSSNATGDELITVCGPYDLTTYPIGTPNPTQNPPFFRKSTFDILVRTIEDVQTVKDAVRTRVNRLLDQLNKLDTVGVNETMTLEKP